MQGRNGELARKSWQSFEDWYIDIVCLSRLVMSFTSKLAGTSHMPAFCDWPSESGVAASKSTRSFNSVTQSIADGSSRPPVYKSPDSKGFVGYGDADPSNVSSLVHGAEMRVAETRAVNRALRKAYGIGLCSVEELGGCPRPIGTDNVESDCPFSALRSNGRCNGQPRLRDRLCLLIRQHQLDANLVKAYAADYCGTTTLREASRDSH